MKHRQPQPRTLRHLICTWRGHTWQPQPTGQLHCQRCQTTRNNPTTNKEKMVENEIFKAKFLDS